MTKRYFEEVMEELGYHVVDTVAASIAKEWPFSVQNTDAGLELRIVTCKEAKQCVKELKSKGHAHIAWRTEKDELQSTGYVLVASMSPPSNFYVKSTLHTALMDSIAVLTEHNYLPPKVCPLCEQASCDCWAHVEDECRPVHLRCLKDRLDLPQDDKKIVKKTYGTYWSGVLGALIGAAVAALPNWAQALSDGSVNQVLYLFLPFMAALLYRLFRGKANLVVAGITVLAASLLVAFGLELIWFWVTATNEAGYNISLAETTALYFEIYSWRLTFQNMAFSLLFLILGFFASSILLRRYVNARMVSEQVIRGSKFVNKSAFSIQDDKVISMKTLAEKTN